MNAYCNVAMAKAGMRRNASADTSDDAEIARVCERVARHIDGETNRPMYSVSGARYYQCSLMPGTFGSTGRLLLLGGDDLISASSITMDSDNNGTYDLTLVVDTAVRYWPYNAASKGEPYRGLELIWNNTTAGVWSPGPHSVKVVGVFGYSNETEAIALTGTLSDAADTSLTTNAAADSLIYVGDTLVIESEQLDVTAVSGTTVTVTRGINGSTAAAHTTAAIYRRRYPRDIEEIAVLDVARLMREEQTGGGGYQGENGSYSIAYPRIAEVLSNYSAVGVI